MEKPVTKISDAANAAKLNEKGLDVETASLPVVSKALKLVFGFCDFDHVEVLQETRTADHSRMAIALPDECGELAGRIRALVTPFAQHGVQEQMVAARWAYPDPSYSYPYQLSSLAFDITPAKKQALLKALAGFVNEEAALGNEPFTWFTGDRTLLLKQLSQMQADAVGLDVA